ncbi:ABC transporter permease [Phyllobacterium brassicacearum]|uniref:ABC transporter permease n=1 Tax=Phyllobacterium brassicacearum TaxID=314235 RepID=A0A2P7BEE5_9HYPH|nr:iron ABC transporter permease [Phyllobacterium brassicacearum]PSH64841.1 ABC transporter permease [Phyllobacterium brassicacearum]TDQ21768.1 iron(III) transport system permease protein [Phyllobacterium brassicacearum]
MWHNIRLSRLIVLGVILLLSLLPVTRLLLAAVAPGGELDIAALAGRLSSPSAVRATLNTLDTAVFGALLALVIGAPFAVGVAMTDLPTRRSLGFLLLLPLMIAPQVMALSWLHLFGPSSTLLGAFGLAPPPGTANPLLGRNGIILLYAIQHAPIVFVTLRAGLSRVPRDLVEAARSAGSSPVRVLMTIVLPMVRPYLVAATALAFVSGVGNFGIPALLGMPVNYLTLTTLIYQRIASFGPSVLPQVAALSVLIAILALLGVTLQALALRKAGHRFTSGTPARFALGRWRLPLALLGWLAILFMLILPGLALVTTAIIPSFGVPLTWNTATLANFEEVLLRQASTSRAFRNSAMLAGGAALILAFGAIPLSIGIERFSRLSQRILHGAIELPYALPGIVLAIACILLFLRPLPLIGSLYATAWIILVAYLMRFFALAMKPVTTAVGQISRDLNEAAAVSGARPLRRMLTITTPLAAPAAVAGALLVFMSAFNELTVSALLWSSGNETLGVVLFSLEEAGLGTQAAAIAVTTIMVVIALLLVLDRLGKRLPAGVLPWR